MKVFVFILGLALILLVNTGEGKRCETPQKHWEMLRLRNKIACRMPTEQVVTLPVPPGYDYLYPKATILNKCAGYVCDFPNRKCVGVDSTNKTFMVKAYTMDGQYNRKETCIPVTVQEDHDCECQCIIKRSDCSKSQKFNPYLCKCVCRQDLENECKKKSGMYMWDPENCACVCDKPKKECSSGTNWVPDYCSCRTVM